MKITKLEEIKLNDVIEILKNKGVIVIPTDTVYGLAADAKSPEAVDKIYKIKERPKIKHVPFFVASIADIKKIAEVGNRQEKFLYKVWPGKVTVVLPFNHGGTVGFRIPNNEFVLRLLAEFGPVVGTSANLSGKPEHTKIKELIDEFKNIEAKPDLIIDAGDLQESLPSTVVYLSGKDLKILREGAVLSHVLQELWDSL